MKTVMAQFLHPGLAWAGLILASAPIIIHILNRRRYHKMDWAAMAFLLAAYRRSVRRLRLEQLLLLLLRCSIVAVLGLGLARPFLSPSALAGLGQARRHHVMLMDNSLSTMAAATEQASVFDEIKRQALWTLDSFDSTDTVTVITLASPATVAMEGGSYDRQLVRERIEAVQPSYRATDLGGGLRLARQALEGSEMPKSNRAAILFTDNVRAAWLRTGSGKTASEEQSSAVRRAGELPEAGQFTIVQVSPGSRDNLSIQEFAPEVHLVGTLLPTPLRIVVANHSDLPAKGVRAQILLNSRIVRELDVPALEPRQQTTLRFRIQFERPGEQNLQATLTGGVADALDADSKRYLTMDATETARVLLVDGKPAARRFESQCGYLEIALAPGTDRRTARQIEPKVVTDAELKTEVFGEYGMIMLCNVRRPSLRTWERLEEFVREGGALVVFLGDNILADHYNRDGYAEGRGVLACPIGGRAMAGDADESTFVLFSREDLTHPVMADFAGHTAGSLFLARTRQYFRPAIDSAEERAGGTLRGVLKFDNGDPAIVERLVGQGTSLLVTTTANMEWTNLPAKGDFVSLMWSLVGYAWPRAGVGRHLTVGAPIRHELTAAQFSSANEFVLPGGERQAADVVPAGDGFAAELRRTDRPGFYRHESTGASSSLACNVDTVESDLQPISESELRKLIGVPLEIYESPMPGGRLVSRLAKRELGWHLLYLGFVLILVEPPLGMWFGQHR